MLQKQYFANKLTGFCIMEISAINKVISFLNVFWYSNLAGKRLSGVIVVNFERVSHHVLVF